MVLDALRAYLQLASGVTEESRQRAVAVARSVLAQTPSVDSGATGQLQQQVAALAEDLVVTSRANRELLLGLIRTEVERTLSRLGIASADEVDTLRRSVERLERLVREQGSHAGDAATAARPGPRKRAATKTAAATPSRSTKAGSVTKTAGATVESGTERPRARRASRAAAPAASAGPARRTQAGPAPTKSAAETTAAETTTIKTTTAETTTPEDTS
jgi:hypothetical protein